MISKIILKDKEVQGRPNLKNLVFKFTQTANHNLTQTRQQIRVIFQQAVV
jgi:hypothetical protein